MIGITTLQHAVSVSGKYLLFYGQHYERGHTCWVVGAYNRATKETWMRHYNTQIDGCVAPEAQAKTYWEEFSHKMTSVKEGMEYEPSYLEDLQKYFN